MRLHAGATYRVYMIGFAPGFAYLGGLPEAIHTSRPQRSATAHAAFQHFDRRPADRAWRRRFRFRAGWRLIGRTPARTYDPARETLPFLLAPGDEVRFEPVSALDYEVLCRAAEAGDLVARKEPPDP